MPTPRKPLSRRRPMSLVNAIKIAIVMWTAGLLTAYYAQFLPKMDATFIAGLLTSTLGSLGIDIMRKSEDDDRGAPPTRQTPTNTPKP